MNKHEKIHGGECCSPQLIQTLDAHLHGNGGYFPPGQNIPVSLPLDPKSDLYKEVWHEPGDVISKDIVKGKCEILDVLTSAGFCYPALYDGRLQFHHEADSILFFLVNCD